MPCNVSCLKQSLVCVCVCVWFYTHNKAIPVNIIYTETKCVHVEHDFGIYRGVNAMRELSFREYGA